MVLLACRDLNGGETKKAFRLRQQWVREPRPNSLLAIAELFAGS
jgi:hypothetical protein